MKRELMKQMNELLANRSPFGIQTEGRLLTYERAEQAYYEALMLLWSEFPRGFIDMPLFMWKYQGLTITEARQLCHHKEYALCRIWDVDDKERRTLLRQILQVLLRVTEVDFDETAYQTALTSLDIWLVKNQVAERTENGAIVSFVKR